ncbi:MAG: hypothetical protein V1668_04180 [Patescibacteria group bacterium]
MKRTYNLYIALAIVLGGLFGMVKIAAALPGDTSTFLGKMYTGDGGPAAEAYLDMPKGFTFGPGGALFIADTVNNVIRKINTSSVISTYSGNGEYGSQDGALAKATWSEPEGITYDGGSKLYVADTGSGKIRRISGNSVSTLPISGLKRPHAVFVSGTDLYISDTGNNRVVKTSINGGPLAVLASGLATPLKIFFHGGTLYVAELDSGNIVAIDVASKTKRILASGFTEPRSITYYQGYLYITAGPSGMYNEIWRINLSDGEATMLVRRVETELLNQASDMLIGTWSGSARILLLQSGGSSIQTTDIDGQDLQLMAGRHRYGDEMGAASRALLGRPQEIVASPDGTRLYISYAQGNKIAEYNIATDQVRMVAGYLMDNYREGTGGNARFSDVVSMAMAPNGKTLYVADRNGQRIRTLDIESGTTHYLTGAGIVNLISPQNPSGNIDVNMNNGYQEGGPCPDTYGLKVSGCAYFNRPTGLALTKNGKTLYVADGSNNRIRKITVATGETALVAGSGKQGFVDGVGIAASFNGPYTLVLSYDEKILYVVDKYNHAIRAINLSTNRVSTLVGTGKQGYREGTFTKAVLATPEYIELGPDKNLYISEAGSLRVRKLDLTRKETSLVSGSGERGRQDGKGETSEWSGPKGMVFLGDQLLAADFKNDLIRKIDLAGRVPDPYTASVARSQTQFFAFNATWRGGFSISSGDISGDGSQEIIVGAAPGYAPTIRIFSQKGALIKEFNAYAATLKTGLRVASCDLDGDAKSEIVAVPGKGAAPQINIFNASGQMIRSFYALDGKFRGGTGLACGDVNGDGQGEIIVSALEGGGPHVTIHNSSGKVLGNFMAYAKSFRGGIELGLADIDANGVKEILTVPARGNTHVQIFSGQGRRLSPGFTAFESSFRGGATVAGGDINGDGTDEIFVAAGLGRANEVRLFNKRGIKIKAIRPFPASINSGLRVFANDLDGNGSDELLAIPALGGAPQVRAIDVL